MNNGLMRRQSSLKELQSPLRELRDDFMQPTRDALFSPFQQIFDKFYEDFWSDFQKEPITNLKSKSSFPKWDIYSDNKHWVVEVGIPGIPKEKINVEIVDVENKRLLKISGQIETISNEETDWVVRELRRSSFERSVYLPNEVTGDPVATMTDGVLKLVWEKPKATPPPKQSKTIPIN